MKSVHVNLESKIVSLQENSTRARHLLIQSEGQGYPLVLFHGWGFDHRIWAGVVPLLAAQYTVYLVDLPGFGQTDLMDWDEFKRLLLMKLPSEFALLGWSLGGLYAMRLALEEQARISHLLTVGATPCLLKAADWPGLDSAVLRGFLARFQLAPEETVANFLVMQTPSTDTSQENFIVENLNLLGLHRGLEQLMTWDLRLALKDYHQPSCLVFGRFDQIVSHKTAAVMRKQYPQFEYCVLKQAGHSPFLSHPQDFLQIVRGFL